jgi:hypothetical protein
LVALLAATVAQEIARCNWRREFRNQLMEWRKQKITFSARARERGRKGDDPG